MMSNCPLLVLFTVLLAMLVVVGCTNQPAAEEPDILTVFAAASLTDAFTELSGAFAAEHPETSVLFNFAGSNQLATQIGQSAPADVFASANEGHMAAAIASGRIDPDAHATFATNRLVVIYPTDNQARIETLQDLANDSLLLVLAAPEVPVGQYTLDFLEKTSSDPAFGPDFRDAVLANVVSSEQNVRAVLTKVALGEADAGIVYASDLAANEGERVGRLEIPDELNTIAVYPIAALNDSALPQQARAFVDFVLSKAGQEILARYGFIPEVGP